MFQKLILKCDFKGEARPSYNWGSLMHGVLMEILPDDTVNSLHESNLRPFSQYVVPLTDSSLEWHIGIWDKEVGEAIARTVMPLTNIQLKHKNIMLEVAETTRSMKSEHDFFAHFFSTDNLCRRYQLEFVTPCTHKSDGEYVLYPTPKLIIQSLHARFCAFAQDFSLDDEQTMMQLVEHTRVTRYSLRSALYHLESIKVNGYMGRITLSIRGPEQLARLTGMLLSFAEYAGIGIKTSLGMGGCRVTPMPIDKNEINSMEG